MMKIWLNIQVMNFLRDKLIFYNRPKTFINGGSNISVMKKFLFVSERDNLDIAFFPFIFLDFKPILFNLIK